MKAPIASPLSRYGIPMRSYYGTGRIYWNNADSEALDCSFEVSQFSNAHILLVCVLPSYDDIKVNDVFGKKIVVNLMGTTNDGNSIEISGVAICFSAIHNGTELTFQLMGDSKLKVGKLQSGILLEVRFALTNFRYLGKMSQELTPNQHTLGLLPLNLGGTNLVIRRLPDYDQRINILAAQNGIDVTCEAVIKDIAIDDLEDLQKVVSILCKLLTIANGTLITWPYFEVASSDNSIIYTCCRPANTRRFSSDCLIDWHRPDDLISFVLSGYENYQQLDAGYQLAKVVGSYVEIRSDSFLETRALVLSSLIDFLANAHAESKGKVMIMNATEFRKKSGALRASIRLLLREALSSITDEQTNEMVKKLPEFNRPTFRSKLIDLTTDFQVKLAEDEIDRFIKARDILVHTLTYPLTSDFRAMIYLLDRILLRMLGYKGLFLNAQTYKYEILADT